jgi:hypothetical protein
MVFHILKKSFLVKAANFLCTRSSLLESVIVTEFQATEAFSSLDQTKAKYSISRLSMVEKENISARINPNSFNACEERKSTLLLLLLLLLLLSLLLSSSSFCQAWFGQQWLRIVSNYYYYYFPFLP